jgi:protein subunit release factor B
MSPTSSPRTDPLAERLSKLGIREEDLDETFVRSGGKGGQNVNKVATCVVLVHRPTATAVKCQRERTQALNRRRAREMLADKIEKQLEDAAHKAAAELAKRRRQRRRRSSKAKEAMLGEKRARAVLKRSRRPVRGDGEAD